jgi:hypothetical protein
MLQKIPAQTVLARTLAHRNFKPTASKCELNRKLVIAECAKKDPSIVLVEKFILNFAKRRLKEIFD